MSEAGLTVAVIGASRTRMAIVEEGLRSAVVKRVVLVDAANAVDRLASVGPDVVVVVLESPTHASLAPMIEASKPAERPVVMFVDHLDPAMMRAATEGGVSAYVVDGLRAERVKAVLDVAIVRFEAFDRLRRELAEARSELADRKLIDRAKGIIMKARDLSEEAAYALLRRTAMNQKRKMGDIARSVVTSAEILG